MIEAFVLVLLCLCGCVMFRKNCLNYVAEPSADARVSVIIPARNEEKNLPNLLQSLKRQTVQPFEIIVCDDHSQDTTSGIAKSYGVTVIDVPPLPENWTGKNWAVWNGFQKSSGDVLVFLDADITLEERALEVLIKTRQKSGGVISVVPFHYTKRFYERFSLVLYLLGVFVFTSLFEKNSRGKGLYGSCIVAARTDYEKVNGHKGISSELLDDLCLGKRFVSAGINVCNYIGYGYVSFRMYPYGLMSEVYGFGKGAVLSTANLMPATLLFVSLWIVGLLVCGIGAPLLLLLQHSYALPFLAGYIAYALQIIYFLRFTGKYGWIVPILYPISLVFFIFIMLYSAYRVVFVGTVSWKGRDIKVRR